MQASRAGARRPLSCRRATSAFLKARRGPLQLLPLVLSGEPGRGWRALFFFRGRAYFFGRRWLTAVAELDEGTRRPRNAPGAAVARWRARGAWEAGPATSSPPLRALLALCGAAPRSLIRVFLCHKIIFAPRNTSGGKAKGCVGDAPMGVTRPRSLTAGCRRVVAAAVLLAPPGVSWRLRAPWSLPPALFLPQRIFPNIIFFFFSVSRLLLFLSR